MQPRFDLAKRISPLRSFRRLGVCRRTYNRPESKLNPQSLRMPTDDKGWRRLAGTGRVMCRGNR